MSFYLELRKEVGRWCFIKNDWQTTSELKSEINKWLDLLHKPKTFIEKYYPGPGWKNALNYSGSGYRNVLIGIEPIMRCYAEEPLHSD